MQELLRINLIGRMKDEDFDAVIDVNLKGTFYMMRGGLKTYVKTESRKNY